jgi:hypothetical protein
LAQLCEQPAALQDMLQQILGATLKVSEEVSATYFTHANDSKHSVGTP